MSNQKKQYRIAVIPGDGIGKEVVPEGLRVLEAAAKKHGVGRAFRPFRFRLLGLLRKARRDDAGGLEGARSASTTRSISARSAGRRKSPITFRLWGSLIKFRREFDQYVNLRPVRLMPGVPSPLAEPQARRHRFLGGAREHRGRIFVGRRAHVPGHRARVRHPADRDDPHRRRPHPEIRVRAGAVAAEEAPDLGDQVQRHLDHHALLGRARGGDGARTIPKVKWDKYHIDILHREFRAASGLVRRRGRLQPVRRHPVRSRPGLHRHHRHRAVGQHQSGRQFPLGVRAGARLGAGYRGPGHRQPDRHDLVRRDDAGTSRREAGRRPRSSPRSSARSANARCAPAISAATPTRSPAARRSRRWWSRELPPSRKGRRKKGWRVHDAPYPLDHGPALILRDAALPGQDEDG